VTASKLAIESAWRSLLSLRDPTALTGRSGQPAKTFLLVLAVCIGATQVSAGEVPEVATRRRLVIAFASHRERPAFANLYFYRHDGVGKGELTGSIPALFERADSHPSLTSDGAVCAYASKQVGGFTPLVNFWNRHEGRTTVGPAFNADAGARIEPCVSGDGKLLAFCARGQAGSMGGWDVQLFNMAAGTPVELPGLNSEHDEREVTLSRDGRWLAFVTNRAGSLSDIGLYDRQTAVLVRLDELNTSSREINPSLSADGRWLAFVSDRPGGAGGKDIYLYDCVAGRLIDLPGLNSVAHEQTPALSPDGRFVAFVSERTAGAGERDIYLYDRQASRLVPTPGLNSKEEDFDPCLAYEGGEPE
jgi:dipeptidyl aminopeptidase/acylaminoacyl peptidase